MEWKLLLLCFTFCLNNCEGKCYLSNTEKEIIDFQTSTHYIKVSEAGLVKSVNVRLNIFHNNVGDLSISLKHNDTKVELVQSYRARYGNGFLNTTFDDLATKQLPRSSNHTPITGTYLPYQPLSKFARMEISGLWALIIYDSFTYDFGELQNWALCITTTNADTFKISNTRTSVSSATSLNHLHSAMTDSKFPASTSAAPSISFTSTSQLLTAPNGTTMTTTIFPIIRIQSSAQSESPLNQTATAVEPESSTPSESLANWTATTAEPGSTKSSESFANQTGKNAEPEPSTPSESLANRTKTTAEPGSTKPSKSFTNQTGKNAEPESSTASESFPNRTKTTAQPKSSTPSESLAYHTATTAETESSTPSESLANRTATTAETESSTPSATSSTNTTGSGTGKQDQTKPKPGVGPLPIAFIVIGALVAVLLLGAAIYMFLLRGKTAAFSPTTIRMSNLRNHE